MEDEWMNSGATFEARRVIVRISKVLTVIHQFTFKCSHLSYEPELCDAFSRAIISRDSGMPRKISTRHFLTF